MSEMRYYQMWTSTTEPLDPAKDWREWFDREHCCRECLAVISEVGSVDCYVAGIPENTIYTFVIPGCIDVMARSLLDCFLDLAEDYVFVGHVFDLQGNRMTDFVTLRVRERITIRGGRNSMYRHCAQCGAHVYTPVGSLYILRSSITGAPIYGAVDHVINEDIYRRITSRTWNDEHMHLDPLPILDHALDGLEHILP